jgi:hypothetical protein
MGDGVVLVFPDKPDAPSKLKAVREIMKPLLLDINIIVDVLRKRDDRYLLIEQLLNQGQPLASCPTTITEIYAGMRTHEEKPMRAFMRSLLFFPITKRSPRMPGC